MESYVDVKRLSPPSFYNVPMRTEALPSFPGESTVWIIFESSAKKTK